MTASPALPRRQALIRIGRALLGAGLACQVGSVAAAERGAPPSSPAMSPAIDPLFDQLQALFQAIRSRFTPVPEQDDTWNDPRGHRLGDAASGDCEDFALLCWWHCRQAGLPARLVLCTVPDDWPRSGHAVCEVSGWILDVRQRRVMARERLPYRWHFVSSPDLKNWFPITG